METKGPPCGINDDMALMIMSAKERNILSKNVSLKRKLHVGVNY